MNQTNLTIFLCQLCSSNDFSTNLVKINEYLAEGQRRRADIVVFPEHSLLRGSYAEIKTFGNTEQFFIDQLSAMSSQYQTTIVWGGLPIIYSGKLYNTSLVIDSTETVIGRYKKIHLFQLINKQSRINERALFEHGTMPVIIDVNDWKIGLTICYDLRFPELFRAYTDADLVLCTSEFTHFTGKSHWEILLKARAIENQYYLAGVNQCGLNESIDTKAYGHTMLIDPWGKTVSNLGTEDGFVTQTINKEKIRETRYKLPSLKSIQHHIKWQN